MELGQRHHAILRAVRDKPQISRRDLCRALALRPNTVGDLVDELLAEKLLQEGPPRAAGRGRPQVPLTMDPTSRSVAGIAVQQRQMQLVQLNLLGEPISSVKSWLRGPKNELQRDLERAVESASQVNGIAAIGISVPGVIDLSRSRMVSSVASTRAAPFNLSYLAEAFEIAVTVDNDIHAVAAQWVLSGRVIESADTLLIYLGDGALGSSLLIGGRPNRGCVLGGNELGHTRFDVETDRCYCGETGCLERICSTQFLRRHGDHRSLLQAAAGEVSTGPIRDLCHHLAMGLSNCINFIRPHSVHLITDLSCCGAFCASVEKATRQRILASLNSHVSIDWFPLPSNGFVHAAAWLALMSIYFGDWRRRHASM